MTVRPTAEQRATYLETWPAWLNSDDSMARMARDTPKFKATMMELHVAGRFLQEIALKMGHSEHTVEDACHKLGRNVAMGRDPWNTIDKFVSQLEQLKDRDEEKKVFASTPVPQELPEPTNLFEGWFKMAKNCVGDEGIYPQQYHRVASDGGVTIEAIAMDGNAMMKVAIDRLRTDDVAEFVMGIDMSAMEGQDIEFADFLAVIWYVNGEFYTGVLNYQKTGDVPEGEEPAFRDVSWTNNYWSNALRQHPISGMQKAIDKASG